MAPMSLPPSPQQHSLSEPKRRRLMKRLRSHLDPSPPQSPTEGDDFFQIEMADHYEVIETAIREEDEEEACV